MTIAACVVIADLELPWATSLKEKRSAIRSVIAKAQNDLRVSASEVGFQNRIRSSTLAFAIVGSSESSVQRVVRALEQRLEENSRVSVSDFQIQWMETS